MTVHLDREQARTVLASRLPQDPKWVAWIEGTLDELEGCVPPQSIDRDALVDILDHECVWEIGPGGFEEAPGERVADAVLALVQPVEGVTLTPEEAQTALEGCGNTLSEFEGAWPEATLQRFRDLESRLVREVQS